MDIVLMWVKQIFAISVFSALLQHLMPQEKYKQYIKFVCATILTLICINPVLNLVLNDNIVLSEIDKIANMQNVYELSQELEFKAETKDEELVEVYRRAVEKDIKGRCEEVGVRLKNVTTVIDTDEESEEYGKLQKITVNIYSAKDGNIREEMINLKKEIVEVYDINSTNVSVNCSFVSSD